MTAPREVNHCFSLLSLSRFLSLYLGDMSVFDKIALSCATYCTCGHILSLILEFCTGAKMNPSLASTSQLAIGSVTMHTVSQQQ